MNEFKFDKKIREKLNKNNVSKDTTYTIIDTIKSCKENTQSTVKPKFRRLSIGSVAAFVLTPCVVLASGYAFINFGLNNAGFGTKSLDNATESGYVQIADSTPVYEKDVNYKFSEALLNNNLLLLSMDFNFEDNIDEFKDVSFRGLEIYDNNGNQIYRNSEDQNIWTKNVASSFANFASQKEDKHIKETLLLTSSKFNNIEKLNVKFNSVVLYIVENGVAKTKEISTTKDLDINLDVKFNERENISYNIAEENKNSDKFAVTKMNLINTGLIVTFDTDEDFSAPAYKFELLDKNDNVIYSNKNIVSVSHENYKEGYVWLDVEPSLKEQDNFKIKILDNNGAYNTYVVNK